MFKRIRRIQFNSIRLKVGLFYTCVLGGILVLYTGVLYFGQRYTLYRDLERELTIKAQEVESALNSFLPVLESDQRAFSSVANAVIRGEEAFPGGESNPEAVRRWREMRENLNLHNDYILLASADAKAIVRSPNIDEQLLSHFLKGSAAPAQKAVSYRNLTVGSLRLRVITVPYYYKNKPLYTLQVASSVVPFAKALYGRTLFALSIIPLVILFTAFLGGTLAARALQPVKELTSIARTITHKDLSARVKVEGVEEELRYLVDAFNEMISRLDKSFRYIAEFSSNVAHELRTPLTVILGESDFALMKERSPQEYRRVIKVIQDECEGMIKTAEDLLLLSRLEYQPQALQFEQLDFSTFIEEVFEQAKRIAARKGITVKLSAPRKSLFISADGLHLKRMFLNLLNNAVKFTPPGGAIDIDAHTEGRQLKVAIRDTGAGINPEHIGKIFDRFFRVDTTGHDAASGSGLGLSIVQSILRIHGGDIAVKSQPNKGSTFTVTLPL